MIDLRPKRLVMRWYRSFAPLLALAGEARARLLVPYEAYDRAAAASLEATSRELSFVLGASDTFALWRYTRSFEGTFARWCGRRHGVGTSSGTAALQLCLVALGIGPGCEVITTAHTFIATALAIRGAGATPVLVDPGRGDLCLRAEDIERAMTPRTRAILPVHMHGHVCDMAPILALAEARGIPVIEDCAQAHGARYRGQRVPIGPIGCFSFWPSKPLGALGNAGMLVTDHEELATRVERARDPEGGDPLVARAARTPGFMDAVQAAVLTARLPLLEGWLQRRAWIANRYRQALAGNDLVLPGPDVESAWYSFVLRTPRRDAIRRRLLAAGIDTRVEYAQPFFDNSAFADCGWSRARWPVACEAAQHGLSLPVHPHLTDAEVERVLHAARRAPGGHPRPDLPPAKDAPRISTPLRNRSYR